MTQQHPVFLEFEPFLGAQRVGCWLDYSGSQASDAGTMRKGAAAEPAGPRPLPPFNEECFEWIDLLNSVQEARNNFAMYGLGAGFGRWGVRGGHVARRHALTPDPVLVEGFPLLLDQVCEPS